MSDEAPSPSDTQAMETHVAAQNDGDHQFVLYIAGTSPQSTRAIVNTRKICEEHLNGRYVLEIVDISKNPHLAAEAQIIAAPTLVKLAPLPLRRFIGDMSRKERILAGLGLAPKDWKGDAQ